jgi:hypothetical protein
MENHRIIDFEEIENTIQLNIDSFKLYLNSVGGHSLFIEISRKYLIKISEQNINEEIYLTHVNFKSKKKEC